MKPKPIPVWKNPLDPLKALFIQAGMHFPALFDAYLALRHGQPGPWTYIVYSDGHAGTTSLHSALLEQEFRPAFHLHMLCPENIKTVPHYPRNVPLIYYKALVEKKRPMKIISMVRNPIDRNVSAFFRALGQSGLYSQKMRVREAVEEFTEYYEDYEPRDWFSTELEPALGIDVYSQPFPIEKGYIHISKDNIDLLILRLELDNSIRESILCDFLPAGSFSWNHMLNSAKSSIYFPLYKKFREQAVLPEDLLEKFISIRYAGHFYTEKELNESVKLWTRKGRS